MAFTFLSPEWFEAMHELRERYGDAVPSVEMVVRMNLVVADAPFEPGYVHAHVETSAGQPRVDEGHLEVADLTVSVDYATAKALLVEGKPEAAMQAFLTGRISVEGDATKLVALAGHPIDETAIKMAEELRDLTA